MRSRGESGFARAHAQTGLLLALAATIGYLETVLVPAGPVPGVRLGLANIAVVVALASLGPAHALVVSLGRVALVGLATGALFGPVGAMSASAALASWTVMSFLHACGDRFSPIGWSVAGAGAHVFAQLAAAAVLVSSPAVLSLAPLSLALSLPTGLAIGLVARTVLSRLSRQFVPVVEV